MKTSILILTIFSFSILPSKANTPSNIEDKTEVAKNSAYFSTQSMIAFVNFNNSNLITLTLNKTTLEKVKFSIVKNGVTLFSDSYINEKEIQKGYDISEFPKGKYIIVVSQGNQKFEKMIEKTTEEIY